MKVISKISDVLYNFEKAVAVLLMSLMLASIAFGVLFRYVLGNPLTWSDELAIYMLIWITFLGGSMSIKTGRAAHMELVFDRVNLIWKRVFLVAGYAIIILFTAIVAYMALQWITNPSVKTQISPGLKISMFLPYLSIPFGLICLTIHSINHLLQSFTYQDEDHELISKGGD